MSSWIDDDGESSGASSSSSSDDDVVRAVAVLTPYLRSYYVKQPRTNSILQGAQYYRELVESENEHRFYDTARMRKDTFFALLRVLRSTGRLESTDRVTDGKKLLILLRVLTGTTNRTCSERWQVSGTTVSAAIHEVIGALSVLRSEYIKPPSTSTPKQIASSPKFYPYFSDCIGAIDGTHIPAIVSAEFSAAFRNRKGFTSQNVLAACDFDMFFCYILAGWEGSAHDSRVYGEALRAGFPSVNDKHYLADAGYSLSENTLTPYRGVRYHLKEWAAGNQRPQTKEELFNLRHASLRNVIERVFGVFKQKFPLMRKMQSYSFETQVELVLASAVIFNFIRRSAEPAGPLDELSNFNQQGATQEELQDDGGDANLDSNGAAKRMRDRIASRMWTDYQVYIAGRDSTVVV